MGKRQKKKQKHANTLSLLQNTNNTTQRLSSLYPVRMPPSFQRDALTGETLEPDTLRIVTRYDPERLTPQRMHIREEVTITDPKPDDCRSERHGSPEWSPQMARYVGKIAIKDMAGYKPRPKWWDDDYVYNLLVNQFGDEAVSVVAALDRDNMITIDRTPHWISKNYAIPIHSYLRQIYS